MAESAAPVPTLLVSTAVTPDNQGQVVVLAGWLCMIAGVLCTFARLQIRWPLPALAGKDDYVCALAAALAVIQTAITFRAVDDGFGRTERDLEPNQAQNVQKIIYATDLIFLLSLWTGKLSVSFLFHRLAADSNKKRLGWGLTGLTAVFGVVSIFVVALRQDVSRPWSYDGAGVVGSTLARWAAVGALNILLDIIIAGLSIYLVWGLQMDPTAKRLVIVGFFLRLFLIPVTVVRLVSLSAVDPADFSLSSSLPATLTQLEMHGSVIATTLPCLRLFLRAWNTSFMDMRLEELDPQAYVQHVSSQGRSQNRSIPMSSLRSKSKLSQLRSKERPESPAWRNGPEPYGGSRATVQGGQRDEDAASDNSRRAIVMKQTVDITHE